MAEAVPLSGSIDPKAFPFLIGHLHRQAATGSLKVDGPSYQKAVYLRGGRILFGSSNDPKDQLGAILIESGRISPEQLEDVNAKVGPGNPLAKVLAESGFVSQRELSEAARAKVERILSDVMAYTTGSFEFEDGVLPKGAVDLKLATEKVIVAAVRRIEDRSFALRHVGGLDAVFVPAANAAAPLAEIEADTGPVVRKFDGRRTLKDAAAEAPLDEFDTSKIACGLLFLGLLERASDAAIETTMADSGPLFSPDELESSLNIGESAPMPAPETQPASDATLLISDSRPEPLVVAPLPVPTPPLAEPPIPPPAPRSATPPPRSPTPPVRPPAAPPAARPRREPKPATVLPPAPEIPAITSVGTTPLATASYEPAEEQAPPPPAAVAPPSKEDLAALDALLNARHVEGPLEPMAKSAETHWEPHFAQASRGGRPNKRRSRKPLLFAVAAAVVAIAGVAAWMLLPLATAPAAGPGKPPATTLAVPVATTLASETTSTLAAVAPASVTAAPVTLGAPTTLRAAQAASTPGPPPATPAPAHSSTIASLADARAAFLKGDLAPAAHGFTANLKAAGRDAHTVQLLVACSDDTVHKAAQAVSAPELFIVPVDYKGRSCYRICWGIYDSESKAKAAVASVPDYFRKGGAVPKAVPAAMVLP